ncbi:uncharacterized protein LOC134820171 [Bolinopsis microptera]|uniref:uncharacterized protein LOC134820171 n=1 Tax=Bolinopsis microptera TaxID=2820187 RepID=UPI00307AD68D
MNIAIAIIVAMVARAQSLNCYKCQDANLKSGVENTCTKYSVQQCAAGKDVCASRATTFYEGSKFSYMKSYQCMTTADESSELDECMGFKSEFEDALDDLKAYACAIEKCNDDLCNGLIVPGSGFTPVPNHGYEIKILNGPASGYFLTANDERNGHSRWVHTELNDQSARWEIILTQHNGQDCFNIKSKSGATAGIGKMLVVHSDKQSNGDARALVHRTPHGNGDDECWIIETVTVVGGVGYRFKKSQGRSRDTYLVSRIQRESGSYWVDVTSDMSAPICYKMGSNF